MKYVDYDTAVTLQEFGYKGDYYKLYNTAQELIDINKQYHGKCIPAPRLEDIAYWLEENYGTGIDVYSLEYDSQVIGYQAVSVPYVKHKISIQGETRHEVLNKSIKLIIDCIINKSNE